MRRLVVFWLASLLVVAVTASTLTSLPRDFGSSPAL